MSWHEFVFKNNKKKFTSEIVGKTLWVHCEGVTYCRDLEFQGRRRRRGSGGGAKNEIHAPMPGKITKILASVGGAVQKGEPLIVMEAMKMEYTLKSEMDGRVQEIPVRVGDQVNLGALLVKLEETSK
ncbi:MAG: acetyl-CoA carboxylase biotin carboxyl carrier protein subunit [Bdellovibrionaceae bacterium]|nr:acetyl-CoA carboxylase biotin carboxyl carrier protein subunit [Pseudobdellovibrionaceae bacterium]